MNQVLNQLQKKKVVAILRRMGRDDSFFVMEHLLEAGITNFEISLNTEQAPDLIREAVKRFGHQALIGAGTVMNREQAETVVAAGAQFLFAPNLSEAVVEVALRHDILMAPGVFSPTEIQRAFDMGCPLVKLFPASTLGGGYIRQVLSPLEGVRIMAVGGIDHSNMDEYLASGAVCVGIGSAMTPAQMVKTRDSQALLRHMQQYVR